MNKPHGDVTDEDHPPETVGVGLQLQPFAPPRAPWELGRAKTPHSSTAPAGPRDKRTGFLQLFWGEAHSLFKDSTGISYSDNLGNEIQK